MSNELVCVLDSKIQLQQRKRYRKTNWINGKRTRKTNLTKDQEVNLKNEAENQSNKQKRLAVNQSHKMQWPKTNLIIQSKS